MIYTFSVNERSTMKCRRRFDLNLQFNSLTKTKSSCTKMKRPCILPKLNRHKLLSYQRVPVFIKIEPYFSNMMTYLCLQIVNNLLLFSESKKLKQWLWDQTCNREIVGLKPDTGYQMRSQQLHLRKGIQVAKRGVPKMYTVQSSKQSLSSCQMFANTY